MADTCEHNWVVWPETDGQEQKCMKCGAYRFMDQAALAAEACAASLSDHYPPQTRPAQNVAWRWRDDDNQWQSTCDEDRASYEFRVNGREIHDLFDGSSHATEIREVLTCPTQPADIKFGISGAMNEVEALAIALWAERCPGIVMGDEDLSYYENAARAAFAELDGAGPQPADMEKAVEAMRTSIRYSIDSTYIDRIVFDRTIVPALTAAAPFLRGVADGIAPVHELLERIEHDDKMMKIVARFFHAKELADHYISEHETRDRAEAATLRKYARIIRELGPSMSPGALAATLERRADAIDAAGSVS